MKAKIKHHVSGRVGIYNVATDGKYYMLLQPKNLVMNTTCKNKPDAIKLAQNLIAIHKLNQVIDNQGSPKSKNSVKDRKLHTSTKASLLQRDQLELENMDLCIKPR